VACNTGLESSSLGLAALRLILGRSLRDNGCGAACAFASLGQPMALAFGRYRGYASLREEGLLPDRRPAPRSRRDPFPFPLFQATRMPP
jgi:hypothetical protein